MVRVFATVGMGRWPFDRLINALEIVAQKHEVFAQIGTGSLVPTFPHQRFMAPSDLDRHIAEADVVVSHGGNQVRCIQRLGKVPIVVAREAQRGEMANDHQVRFVKHEARRSPMVAMFGSLADLGDAVDRHGSIDVALRSRPIPAATPRQQVADVLRDVAVDRHGPNPLGEDPIRRRSWAYAQVAHLEGPHLDVGCGQGELVAALTHDTDRAAVGVDAEADKLRRSLDARASGKVVQVGSRSPLPFADASCGSASLLDVLEHVWDEDAVLAEVRRVLRPGGTLVVTVPRRHVFTFLDPGNARFRFPHLHRRLYSARHGADRYATRFHDDRDGMHGDTAIERHEHHNYAAAELAETLRRGGFEPTAVDAANLLWRFADIPRSFLPDRWQHLTDGTLRRDGRTFHQANLFMAARRP